MTAPTGNHPRPRRVGALPAMAVGAAIGTVAGNALDTASGGADPAFAGAIGAALGAALGRSLWIRVGAARASGVPAVATVGTLVGRIIGCVLVGVAFVGSLTGAGAAAVSMSVPGRAIALAVGAALLVATAVVEHRWIRRKPTAGHGGSHGI